MTNSEDAAVQSASTPRPRRRHKWRGLVVLLAVTVAALWAGSLWAQSRVNWRDDYSAALLEARTANRPIVLDFWASWCPYCRVMDGRIFSDTTLAAAAEKDFVPVRIDLTSQSGDSPQAGVAAKYNIVSIPAVLIVDPRDETVIARPAPEDEASPAAFVSFLSRNSALK